MPREIHKKVTFCYFKNWIHTGRKKCFWHFASFCSNYRQACGLSAKEQKIYMDISPLKICLAVSRKGQKGVFAAQKNNRQNESLSLRRKVYTPLLSLNRNGIWIALWQNIEGHWLIFCFSALIRHIIKWNCVGFF